MFNFLRTLIRKYKYKKSGKKQRLIELFELTLKNADCDLQIPYSDNNANPQVGTYIGHNKTKVFLRHPDNNLSWIYFDKIQVPENQLALAIMLASKGTISEEQSKRLKQIRMFSNLVGRKFRLRHIQSGEIFRTLKFTLDNAWKFDDDDVPKILPMQVFSGWIDKGHFLHELEFVDFIED